MKTKQDTLCRYNKSLQPLANKLRKEMTKAEACLWKHVLHAGRMQGYSFRRQRPVLNYIADFMCKDLRLVIEVDGITHDTKFEQDRRRTDELHQAGFKVIRFTDDQVLTNIQGVANQIEKVIEQISPPPAPPPAGDKRSCPPA